MPRIRRIFPPGVAHHVLNRGNDRKTVFHKPGDYKAFVELMAAAQQRVPMRILSYCLMRNHFHFVLWPEHEDAIPAYMHWLMNAHIQRYQRHYRTGGLGHIYQGRYKNFPIQTDRHLLTVLKYVEANPLRAGIVKKAEEWRWSALSDDASVGRPAVTPCPVDRPHDWVAWVNDCFDDGALQRLRYSVKRGAPFGDEAWTSIYAKEHGLEFTLHPRGRRRT